MGNPPEKVDWSNTLPKIAPLRRQCTEVQQVDDIIRPNMYYMDRHLNSGHLSISKSWFVCLNAKHWSIHLASTDAVWPIVLFRLLLCCFQFQHLQSHAVFSFHFGRFQREKPTEEFILTNALCIFWLTHAVLQIARFAWHLSLWSNHTLKLSW